MSESSQVAHFFAEVAATMKMKFRGWEKDISHPGEKGGIRERRVRDFLSLILPKKYGIGTGHIIYSQQSSVISPQMDIVIYDAINGVALPVDDYYSLFPCECVYAVVEVKSKLSASDGKKGPKGTIYECVESNTRLKSLDRGKYGLSPIHYIVFGYTTAWSTIQANRVKGWFETFGEKYSKNLPEVVLVLEPSFVLGTSGPTGYNDVGKLTNIYDKEPFLYFISDFIYRLSQTKTTMPNLWTDYINWRSGDLIAKIYRQ